MSIFVCLHGLFFPQWIALIEYRFQTLRTSYTIEFFITTKKVFYYYYYNYYKYNYYYYYKY